MADIEVWGLGGPIAAPAAADRVPIATGSGAGGYSLRGSFVWLRPAGDYNAAGALSIGSGSAAARAPLFVNAAAQDPSLAAGRAAMEINFNLTTVLAVGGGTGGMGYAMWIQGMQHNGGAYANTAFPISINPLGGNVGIGMAYVTPPAALSVRGANELARLTTTTARNGGGNYLTFYDPTGIAGAVGFADGDNTFGIQNVLNGAILFRTNNIGRWQLSATGHFYPQTDNAYSLGAAGVRPSVLWAATGTISTSDEREKTWRGGLTEAELKAATRIIGELGFYQWNDAVAEKGKDARYHFGPRAQRVWQIMAEEKLVGPINGTGKNQRPGKTPYAFLCWDEWDEETAPEMVDKVVPAKFEGKGKDRVEVEPERTERVPTGKTLVTREAGNRFGLRTDQFIMFLMAAQQAQIDAQDARIAALETA